MLKKIISTVSLLTLLVGCNTNPDYSVVGNTDNLQNLENLHAVPVKKGSIVNPARLEGMQEIALSTGAQAGLAWRSKQINNVLTANSPTLDRAFNFNLMLLAHNVIPPVLVVGDNSLNLDNPLTIRIADRTYQIVSQARFATTPPTWRDYLWMSYTKPDTPSAGFLPKNEEEKIIWKKYSAIGWQNGVDQANTIYKENLSRVKRDYEGMARYRVLLAQGMVSPPSVAHSDLGITGDESNMRINDQVLRITALPKLQMNSKRWKPVITP
jgi:defect-in-organelle-trafficking protein DotC